MNLTVTEFAGFSTKSKGEMLSYKGCLLYSKKLSDTMSLQLFSMGNFFAICQISQPDQKVMKVQTSVNADWLYYFVADIDLMAYLPELGEA